jgi:uncharacterized damage-inducible protein DinB
MRMIKKPQPGDYPVYAEMYMQLLPAETDILNHLKNNFYSVKELISSLPPGKLCHRYKKDKWSIKEILVHIIDDERIYAYRALRFARNEKINLPGFDQDMYTRYSAADKRDADNIFSEYEAVRNSTISLFNGLPEDGLDRIGSADNNNATARALLWHIAGHELHHINFIKTNYL